jgi:hypothetical protein
MVYETFTRRRRKERGDRIDVFQYETVPPTLKVQILQIFAEISGVHYRNTGQNQWNAIRDIMRREKGVFELYPAGERLGSEREVTQWFVAEGELDSLLDTIQLVFDLINVVAVETHYQQVREMAHNAVEEINLRMREASFGFEYKEDLLIEINSEFLHSEVTVPALTLLHNVAFATADAEFREAHQDFRVGDYEGTVVECGKALESVLKIICEQREWLYDPKDTAKRLLDVVFERGLVPSYQDGSFKALRSLLEGGVPTIRNKEGGHGAGAEKRHVPKHLAAFQLHQTAAVILFLAEANAALP